MRQCSEERQRLVHMLKESISLMCKTAVAYEIELTVEGLLGITLDKRDVFLVNINECFKSVLQMSADPAETGATPTPSGGAGQKRGPNDNGDSTGNRNSEDQNGKRRRGRQSMDGSGSPQPSQHNNNKNNPPPEASTDFLPNMSVESEDSLVSCEQTNTDQSTKRLQHPLSASDQPKSPQASYTETSFDVSDSGGGLDPQILSHHEDSADIDLGNIAVKREISIEADYAAHLAFSKNNSELQGSFPTSVPVPVAGSSRHNNQVPSNLSSTTAPTTGSSQDSSHPGSSCPASFPSAKPIMQNAPSSLLSRVEGSLSTSLASWPTQVDTHLQQSSRMVPLYDSRGNLLSMEAWKMREYRNKIKIEDPVKYAQTKLRNRLRQREVRRRMSEEKKTTLRVQDRDRMRQHRMVKKIHGMRTVVLQSRTNPSVITTTVTATPQPSNVSPVKAPVAHPSHGHAGPFVTPTPGISLPQATDGPLPFFNSPTLPLFDPHRSDATVSFDIAGHPLGQNCNKPPYFG